MADTPSYQQLPLSSADDLLTGFNILVVEDDLDNLEVLSITLEAQGASVIKALSVAEAMGKFAQAERLDLVISDVNLPGEDGFDLIRQIRAVEGKGDLPAIAVTGYDDSGVTDRLFRSGFQRHIIKPIDMNDLIVSIMSLLS
jgi:two-component system, chemotaxis family, CheB/CheR fusion protein